MNPRAELTLKFTFTQDQANAILQALSQSPWAVANPIIAAIQEQAREQQKETEQEPQPKPEAAE